MRAALRRATACAALVAGIFATIVAQGAEEVAPREARSGAAAPLRFRRVYAPADRVSDWPRGTVRYVPVDGHEFEQLLLRSQEAARGTPSPAVLARATYEAELVDGDSLRGHLNWEIARGAKLPAVVPLARLSLALEAPGAADTATDSPASIGAGENGALALWVTRAGDFTSRFSLAGRRDVDGQLAFTFELPQCTTSVLRLTVPQGVVPSASAGIVSLVAEQDERQTYELLIGGQNVFTVRLASPGTAASRRFVIGRETSICEVSQRGLDVASVWKLDVHGTPLRQLQLSLDPGLDLVSAHLGEADLQFMATRETPTGPTTVVLDLPEALSGVDRSLSLTAIGSAAIDRPWRLPRIHARDVLWQEGTATLVVREPLQVSDLTAHDCRQTKYSVLAEPVRRESFELQLFSDAASVDLTLTRQHPPAIVGVLTDVELGGGSAEAEMTAAFEISAGYRTSISADVSEGWTVDEVRSVPADALGNWRIDTAGDAPRLTVGLAHPLASDAPVRLQVRARRAAPGDQPETWGASALIPLRFRDVKITEQLLSIRPRESFAVRIVEEENAARVDASRAEGDLGSLLVPRSGQQVFRIDAGKTRLTVAVEPQPPAFSATIAGEAMIDAENMRETYTIHCSPEVERVTRLLVTFRPPRVEPWRWRLSGEPAGSLLARRFTPAELADRNLPASVEAWELTLVGGRSAPFDIVAERTVPRTSDMDVSLAALPTAHEQSGTIVVKAAASVGVELRRAGLKPSMAAEHGKSAILRGAFAYEPTNEMAQLSVVQIPPAQNGLHDAVVWHQRTESSYGAAGQALHQATLRICNAGRSEITLAAPAGTRITRAWVNGREQGAASSDRVTLTLPPEQQYSLVVVDYSSEHSGLGSGRSLEAPVVESDLPVMAADWLCWLPPGYAPLRVDGGSSEPNATGLTWSQRLLGPFGRGTDAPPLDIFSRPSWSRLLDPGTASLAQRGQDLLATLDQLANNLERDEDRPAEWGRLILSANDAARDAGSVLLIDGQALSRARLESQTLVPKVRRAEQYARGGVLAGSSLVLLVTPDAFLLTDSTTAAIFRNELRTPPAGHVAVVAPGSFDAMITAAAHDAALAKDGQSDASTRFLAAVDWTAGAADPWARAAVSGPAGLDGVSNVYLVRVDGNHSPRMLVAHTATVTTLTAGFALLAAALCACFIRQGVTLCAVAILALALALALPGAVAFVATGCLWGTLAALAGRHIRARLEVTRSRESHSSASASGVRSASPVVISAVTAMFACAMLAAAARAQSAPNPARNESPPGEFRVFIPVDEAEQPTTDKYQVPERLYDELRRRVDENQSATPAWLLRTARYRLSLERDAISDAQTTSDITVRFELQVMRRASVVRMPLAGVRPIPSARRDGHSVDLDWETDEDGFIARFDEPGIYELELSLRPQRGEKSTALVDMAIPAVPRATLEVALPVVGATIEVPTAHGASSSAADGRSLSFDLGTANRLTIYGGRARQAQPAAALGEADLRFLLQVQPSSVVLHTRIDVKSLKNPLAQLWLSIDPRLRPLPVVDRLGMVSSVQTTPGDPQMVRIDLARPLVDRGTIPVSFLVTGSSGIGQLPVPRVVPQGVTVGERMLGVAVDPALQYEWRNAEANASIAVPEFLTLWGPAVAAPQFALRLADDQTPSVLTRPREQAVTSRERLAVSIGAGDAQVRFDAQIVPVEGSPASASHVLEYGLNIPSDLVVDRVSLVQDSVERLSRTARPTPTHLTLFLAAPVSGRHLLTLEGHLPAPQNGDVPLPRINIDLGARRESTVMVYRQPAVSVTVEERNGLIEIERPRSAGIGLLPGRLVSALAAPTEDFSASLHITPNRPRVRSTLVATCLPQAEAWEGRIECRGSVADGVVDEIALKLPASWVGPFEVTPTSASLDITRDGSGDRRLIVRPRTAIDGDYQFVVRGPLKIAAGESLAPPQTVPLASEETVGYLLLPAFVAQTPVQWGVRGMAEDPLPAGLTEQTSLNDFTVYRVRDPQAAAEWRTTRRTKDTTGAQAHINIAWGFDSRARGLAIFELPADAIDCRMTVPDGVQIVELRADGALVAPIVTDGVWQIPLAPRNEPQIIRAAFTSPPVALGITGRANLSAPSLETPTVARTSWCVSGPAAAGAARPETSASTSLLAPQDNSLELGEAPAFDLGDAATDRWTYAGMVPSLAVRYETGYRYAKAIRLILAALFAVTAGICLHARTRRRSPTLAPPAGAIAGIAVGLLLTAWVEPAGIGLIVVLLNSLTLIGPESLRAVLQRMRTANQ